MKQAHELIPWTVTDISVYPYGNDYWSMNPSIHLDNDGTWRCVARIVDYAMPNGITIRSKKSGPTGQQTKNAMILLDPSSWKPVRIYKMHEKDDHPRVSTPHVGYEDMRLFKTDKGGLQGIAASLHLKREEKSKDSPQHQPPEQVLLSFDGEYNIIKAQPIRGDGFSGSPQKNWSPVDACVEPRFLYSISKGSLFDDRGPVHGDAATIRPSTQARSVAVTLSVLNPEPAPMAELPQEARVREAEKRDRARSKPHPDLRTRMRSGGGDVQITRGRRVIIDAQASRPTSSRSSHGKNDSTRMMGSGRVLLPKYHGLRGGTQLVRVSNEGWLGIGHEMSFKEGRKFYWHVFYLVDARGKMMASSAPMKLAPNGIEFAAGMAIDGDRVVVSFGVDDMECKLGVTSLSAVMEKLHKV